MDNKKNRFSIKKVMSQYDVILALLVLFISVFGLIMIYSASSYRAEYYYQDSTLYFRRQGVFIIAGTVLMILISVMDYRILFKQYKFLLNIPICVYIWAISLVLCYFVLIAGHSVGGSSRWIQLGPANLQPSEVAKVSFVLCGTFVVTKWKRFVNTGSTIKNFLYFFVMFLPFALVFLPVYSLNLSSAIILGAIIGGIFFVVSMDKKYLYIILALVIAALVLKLLFGGDYRSDRLDNWLHPDQMDQGGQIMQGLLAIGSGGMLGKGLGNSVQKLGNIPEVHTDMIFTIICEELGIVGGLALILAFMWMLYRIFKIALRATELKGTLIATGVFIQLAIQILMNIAVVTNSMPATGVPLPFVSYGGSSLLIMMAEVGLVLNVSKQTYEKVEEQEIKQEEQ